MSNFNEHLRILRKSQSKTQKQVALAIEVTERNYQDFEYGKHKPSFDTIIKLCNFFDVSSDYLLGLSDDPKRR